MKNKNIIEIIDRFNTKVFRLKNNITINQILDNNLGQSYYYIMENKREFWQESTGIKIRKTSKL